jgi:hypothetical protein
LAQDARRQTLDPIHRFKTSNFMSEDKTSGTSNPERRTLNPEPPRRGFAEDAKLKVFKVMLRPGERLIFSVLSAEEGALLSWAQRQSGEQLEDWLKAAVLDRARAQVAAANASHKPAPQGVNEIVARLKT